MTDSQSRQDATIRKAKLTEVLALSSLIDSAVQDGKVAARAIKTYLTEKNIKS